LKPKDPPQHRQHARYRLAEPDGRRMLPDKLAAFGITGPDIGRLQREGRLAAGDRLVTVEQVSEPRRGQRVAFIMDTRLCEAAFALADGADMVVCEVPGTAGRYPPRKGPMNLRAGMRRSP
jgi:ribonuclease Z